MVLGVGHQRTHRHRDDSSRSSTLRHGEGLDGGVSPEVSLHFPGAGTTVRLGPMRPELDRYREFTLASRSRTSILTAHP